MARLKVAEVGTGKKGGQHMGILDSMMLERREVTTNTSKVFVVGSFHDPATPTFKANLHCHSTHSDGKLSPQEVAELYAREGYQILCIADHNANGDQDGDGVHDWNLDGVVMSRARPTPKTPDGRPTFAITPGRRPNRDDRGSRRTGRSTARGRCL